MSTIIALCANFEKQYTTIKSYHQRIILYTKIHIGGTEAIKINCCLKKFTVKIIHLVENLKTTYLQLIGLEKISNELKSVYYRDINFKIYEHEIFKIYASYKKDYDNLIKLLVSCSEINIVHMYSSFIAWEINIDIGISSIHHILDELSKHVLCQADNDVKQIEIIKRDIAREMIRIIRYDLLCDKLKRSELREHILSLKAQLMLPYTNDVVIRKRKYPDDEDNNIELLHSHFLKFRKSTYLPYNKLEEFIDIVIKS